MVGSVVLQDSEDVMDVWRATRESVTRHFVSVSVHVLDFIHNKVSDISRAVVIASTQPIGLIISIPTYISITVVVVVVRVSMDCETVWEDWQGDVC
jgi:hypothetical protein